MTKKEKEQLKLLGSRIRTMREKRRWTPYKLSRLSGVQQYNLQMIENGEKDIKITTLMKLEMAFDEKIEY